MERVNIRVTGDVQGVFYRFFTKKKAKLLGLAGWCRNESDGSVAIVAEGEEAKIKELIEWCHVGSPLSRVEKVEFVTQEVKGEEGFEIR